MTAKQFPAMRNCDLFDEIYDLLDIAARSFPIKALAGEIYSGQGSSKAESTLRGELNQQPGHKLGLITALQIVQKTGDLRALDKIEEMFGRVAMSIPVGATGRSPLRPIMELNSDLIRDFGDNMKALGNALKDGSIDEKEAKVCLRELKELITACIRLETYLNHQFGTNPPSHDFASAKSSSPFSKGGDKNPPSSPFSKGGKEGDFREALHER